MSLPLARSRTAAIMAGLVCCAVLARLPFVSNVGVDESYYLVVGRQWLEGTPPYAGAFDVKPPLLFALMAGAEAVFGPALLAAKALTMAAAAATACGLYLFGRRFTGAASGLAAALFYIAASLTFGGTFSPAELLMAPFTAFGMLLGLAAACSRRARPTLLLGAGLLLGAAACVKQTALFEALALAMYLFARPGGFREFGERTGRWQARQNLPRLESLAWLAAGLCAVPSGFALYFLAQGHLDALVADAVLAAIGRAGANYVSLSEAAGRLLLEFFLALPLVVMAAAVFARRKAFRDEPAYAALHFLMVWAAGALCGVCAGKATFVIYFLPVLQPLCLASGVGLQRLIERSPERRGLRLAWPLAAAIVGVYPLCTVAPLIFAGRENLASATAATAAMRSAGLSDSDRILVADRDLIVYLASGSNPPAAIFHPLQFLCDFAAPGAGVALEVALKSRPAYVIAAEPFHIRGCEKPGRRLLIEETLRREYCALGRFGNALTGLKGGSLVVYGLKERVAARCS
jgi:4-amino-4-deoxy-L-arabinose transferase-like glycosyltransferase